MLGTFSPMLEKVVLFDDEPSSLSWKLPRGEGLAVKENNVELFGWASFTIVIEAGKRTAAGLRG